MVLDEDKLVSLPEVEEGYRFMCSRCGAEHILEKSPDNQEIMVYVCLGVLGIGAVRGRLILSDVKEVKN
jgi:hypothetical protein